MTEREKKSRPPLHENPKDAVAAYLQHLHKDYHKWYERSVRRLNRFWLGLQITSIAAGFGTAVLAATLQEELLSGKASAWLVVILPFVGSMATAIGAQGRVRDLWQLREGGRLAFQTLITEGLIQYAKAAEPGDYTRLHERLADEAARIEETQAISFWRTAPTAMR